MALEKDEARLGELAEVLRALGHPLRLRIFGRLVKHESSVGELQALFDAAQSLVSMHLRVLRGASVIDCRREGSRHVYFVKHEGLNTLWQCLRRCRVVETGAERERS